MRTDARKTQRGMALFVSLIFLLLLTIVGVAAMQNASMQEKMAGNVKLKNESFQYAEAGLREGEGEVKNSAAVDACGATSEPQGPDAASVVVGSGTCDVWRLSADGSSHFQIQMLTVSANAPRVPLNATTGKPVSVKLFRVTAVATVGNATSVVESIYAKTP